MPPALYTSWAKEQPMDPGMHEAKAILRSWLAHGFNKRDRTAWWVGGCSSCMPGSKQLPLAREMDGDVSSSVAPPTPPKKKIPLHGFQIKRDAVVPWKGEEIMGPVGCCRVRRGYWQSKGNIMCFLSFFKLFISKLGNSQMYWKLFLQWRNYACSILVFLLFCRMFTIN